VIKLASIFKNKTRQTRAFVLTTEGFISRIIFQMKWSYMLYYGEMCTVRRVSKLQQHTCII